MKKNELTVEVNFKFPGNPDAWDKLAEEKGNLVQSTYYDQVQAFYHQPPLYFEVKNGESLVGGVKLYIWESNKVPFITNTISRTLTQLGEALVDETSNTEEVLTLAFNEVQSYIQSNKVVTLKTSGVYGDSTRLVNLSSEPAKSSTYNIGSIDLTKSTEELWSNIHVKHRNAINKANKNNVVFTEEGTIDTFLDLLDQTYSRQSKSAPNTDFIRHSYGALKEHNLVNLFFAKEGDTYLSAVLSERFGKFASYTFAGNSKNSLGSGNFLQWEIMKKYKEMGLSRYFLGQMAQNKDPENLKFSEGISRFKRRFGASEVSTCSQTFILNKLYFDTWQLLTGLMTKK